MDKKTAPIAEQKTTPAPMPMPEAEMPETEGMPQNMPEQNTMPMMGQNMPTPMCNTCMYGMTNTCPLMMGNMPNNMMPQNFMPDMTPNMMPANIMPNMTPNMMPQNFMPNMTPNMMPVDIMPNMNPNMAPIAEPNMPQVQPINQEKKSRDMDFDDDLDDIDDFEDDYFEGARTEQRPEQFGRPPMGRPPFGRPRPIDPDRCVRMLERNNPAIFRRLVRAGIPYFEAVNIVRRIVSETLQNCCR